MPGGILNETIDRVTDILGSELDALAVERAVVGLYFHRRQADRGHGRNLRDAA